MIRMFQFLLEKVESRPDITLNELKEQLSLKGVQVSVSTIEIVNLKSKNYMKPSLMDLDPYLNCFKIS